MKFYIIKMPKFLSVVIVKFSSMFKSKKKQAN